jgi:hypothetical protein
MGMPFLEEDENSIIRNIHPSELFIIDSFEAVQVGPSVTFIVGKPQDPTLIQQLINPEKVMVQGVKFDKPDWTLESALDWLRDNQKDFKNYQSKKNYAADLKQIKNVEIFSAGVWNGDEFTTKDLDNMVAAFEETKDTVRPFLKLGHSTEQKLLQAEGLPAAGWVGRVFRKGDKLMADFIDLPSKIFELIENKSFRSVSAEIFFGIDIKEKHFDKLLGAVALLGAETPGVMNLSDILGRFNLRNYESIKSYTKDDDTFNIKQYEFNNNDFPEVANMPKTEREIELEQKLKIAEDGQKKAEADVATAKKEFTTNDEALKAEVEKREAAEKKVFAAEAATKKAELDTKVEAMVSEKLITKSMKPFVLSLLGDEPKTKKYSFKDGDKTTELDKEGVFKAIAKLYSKTSDVNFVEGSEEGDNESKQPSPDELDAYVAEHKCSYTVAYAAVAKTKQIEADNN